MNRLRYVLAFLAGAFLTNAIPHLVNGVSGRPFPSPFGDPPGFGDSSPLVNVLWAAFNVLLGYALLRWARIRTSDRAGLVVLLAGALTAAIILSQGFSGRM